MPFTTKPGVAPAGELLFFASPKKPNEKKGDPVRRPLRGTLRCSVQPGSETTRLRLKQVWPDLPPPSALLGPASTGWEMDAGADSGSLKREALEASLRTSSLSSSPNPWRGAEKRRARRIRAETCLSRRRVVSDPGWTEHRRVPAAKRRDDEQGRLSFR